jgi:hypothetical protein
MQISTELSDSPLRAKRLITFARPPLAPYQTEAIYSEKRIAVIEASTKAGKTVGCLTWLIEQAYMNGRPGRHFWWVAPITTQAQIAFTRAIHMLTPGTFTAYRSGGKEHIILLNGAIVWFRSGENPDALYGEDVWAAVIDEASRLKEQSWHAVRSTVTKTRGPIRIIGNVKGRRNWFYLLARKAEKGDDELSFRKITADDAVAAGILSRDEISSAGSDLPAHVFRELYMAEAADDGGNPFDLAKLKACMVPTLSSKAPRHWGWDLAKHDNWTVGVGLDDDGAVCRFRRFRKSWNDAETIIMNETKHCKAKVDSTGVGDPIVEALIRKGGANFEGYKFTGPSKQQLMEGLMAAVQRTEIHFPEYQEVPTSPEDPAMIAFEMETFEYTYTPAGGVRYSAPSGMEDDCVMALALAVAARGPVGFRSYRSWV